MGKYDSSITRVKPVFDQLCQKDPTGRTWLPRLLHLPVCGSRVSLPLECNFTIRRHAWGNNEEKLKPPLALLSWLIRHPHKLAPREAALYASMPKERRELLDGSEVRMIEALELLQDNPLRKKWHIFEGETQPDVFIETSSLLVVIEGKRTEPQPTAKTTWMPIRHQMLRHLDCAWEIRGRKGVVGFFIVQGEDGKEEVPTNWRDFARESVSTEAIRYSLPHRGPEEQRQIGDCFAGVTT